MRTRTMKAVIGSGMMTAALARSPGAWACDVGGYEAERDRARIDGCATTLVVDGGEYRPVDYDQPSVARPVPATATATEAALPGSGGDDARGATGSPDLAEEQLLRMAWNGP